MPHKLGYSDHRGTRTPIFLSIGLAAALLSLSCTGYEMAAQLWRFDRRISIGAIESCGAWCWLGSLVLGIVALCWEQGRKRWRRNALVILTADALVAVGAIVLPSLQH